MSKNRCNTAHHIDYNYNTIHYIIIYVSCSEILLLETIHPQEEIKASINYSAKRKKAVYLQKCLGFF